MISGIYKITNLNNGKIYIGSSKDIKQRFRKHLSELRSGKHSNYHLQAAWDKYGEDNFVFEIIEEREENIRILEAKFIEQTNCLNREFGYNIALTTECPMEGRRHTKKSKEKMRKAKIGKNNNFYGKKHTEETKNKLRECKIGIPLEPEHKAKVLKTAWKKGSSHINAKLNDDIVYNIKKEYKSLDKHDKRGYISIKSKELGVSYSTISRILKGETWTHITVEE